MKLTSVIVTFVVFWLTLVSVTCDTKIMSCLGANYLSEGSCHPCPDMCDKCISIYNCTQCKNGYYGGKCQLTCDGPCPGQCHQIFGHCTLGCPDGQFPEQNSPACLYCGQNCRLCSSLSHCVKCEGGFFGEACETCSNVCENTLCHQTGECLNCKTGYYKDFERKCVQCPDGCKSCLNATSCSECNHGYIGPYYGKCIGRCTTELRMTPSDQSKCLMKNCTHNICTKQGYCLSGSSQTVNLNLLHTNGDLCDALIYQKCTQKCNRCEHAGEGSQECSSGYICSATCELSSPNSTLCSYNNMTNTTDAMIESIEEAAQHTCDLRVSPAEDSRPNDLIFSATFMGALLVCCGLLVVYYCRRRRNKNRMDNLMSMMRWKEVRDSDTLFLDHDEETSRSSMFQRPLRFGRREGASNTQRKHMKKAEVTLTIEDSLNDIRPGSGGKIAETSVNCKFSKGNDSGLSGIASVIKNKETFINCQPDNAGSDYKSMEAPKGRQQAKAISDATAKTGSVNEIVAASKGRQQAKVISGETANAGSVHKSVEASISVRTPVGTKSYERRAINIGTVSRNIRPIKAVKSMTTTLDSERSRATTSVNRPLSSTSKSETSKRTNIFAIRHPSKCKEPGSGRNRLTTLADRKPFMI